MICKIRFISVAIGLLLCTVSMVAQVGVQSKNSLLDVPLDELLNLKVVSASKFSELKSEAPASLIIISKEQIRNRGYFDLSDVMQDLPGVDLVDNARGYGEFYTINGIEGNDRFLVLIDGKKINPPSGTFLSIGNSISVSSASQIEVIYGPASVLYGSDAFSGVINIITEEVDSDLAVSARYGLGSYWSNDLNLDVSSKITEDLSMSFSGRIFRSNGPDFSKTDTIYDIIKRYQSPQRQKFEQPINDHTFYFKTQYKDLIFTVFRQQFDEGNALGVHPNGFVYNRENRWKVSNSFIALDYQKQPSQNAGYHANISLIRSDIDPETRWYKWFGIYNLDSTVSQYMTGSDLSIRSSVNYHNQISSNFRIQTGIEAEVINSVPPYANDQVLHFPVKNDGSNAELIKKELTLHEARLGVVTQLIYQPLPILKMTLGGRYDYATRYQGVFNPRSGIIIEPVKGTTMKALYGTAFQAPSLFFEYEQFGDPWLVMYSMADYQGIDPQWSLKPQRVSTFQFSFNQAITKDIIVGANIFHSTLSNLISRVFLEDSVLNKFYSTPDQPLYSIGLVNANIGEQAVHGASVNMSGRYDQLFWNLSYTFTDAHSTTEDNYVPISRVARHKFLARISWSGKYGTISPRLRLIGKMNNENQIAFPNGKQPGYTQLDIYFRTSTLFKGLHCFAMVNNVLNSRIEHGGLQRQIFGYLPTVIQDGINFRVGFQWDLSKRNEGK